jgi:acetylornithine/succinyldiaminopimelate/putrescine aminotransferase
MTESNAKPSPSTRPQFHPVSLSISDLCGEPYIRALCSNRAFLTGQDASALIEIATQPVEFFPIAFEQRLHQLLRQVGQRVGTPLTTTPRGASTDPFERHTKVEMAPLSALGYFRLGENGTLYLTTKSEHYHASLGHSFPGYALIDRARQLGIPNATHNNTRGFITRRLEEELIAWANGIDPADAGALAAVRDSSSPHVINRVLNLETGSLAAEAALKLVLARFYRSDESMPFPKYHGRIPVILVLGNDGGGLKANYHGTTMLTQMMRGMWPEFYSTFQDRGLRVVPIRPNSLADLEAAFSRYERDDFKLAAFFHEIVMMNYGGRLLSREFLRRAYELCDQHDVATVADEIQSCLWAPGFFLFREYGLRPSLVAVGKGFPGGEYPASRILFSAPFDALEQFGALVTNGQEELAALAYLITMRWATANRHVTAEIGDYYYSRVQELAGEFSGLLVGIDGYRHMTCLRFGDTRIASGFAKLLVERGFDISAQTYKRDFSPSVLTKLPLIAGVGVVDFVIECLRGALRDLDRGTACIPAASSAGPL